MNVRAIRLSAALAAMLAVAPARAAGPTHPLMTDGPSAPTVTLTSPLATQQQVEADRPLQTPATHSCTESFSGDFGPSGYYGEVDGAYTPPANCPAPWSMIVFTLTGTVSGNQYDRVLSAFLGDVDLLRGTTSEPCCTGNAVTWTVQRDVSEYAATFASPQTLRVFMDNYVGSYSCATGTCSVDGVYHLVASVTLYQTGDGVPEAAHPAAVQGVNAIAAGGDEGMLAVTRLPAEAPAASLVFPANLVRLQAEIFASGHGPCEEFFWAEPTQCGAGDPYREVTISIDGKEAGFAPAFPTTYTGADGPGLWEPIPSPRAWNLRPYLLDLSPFVGLLTDGQPHSVQLGIGNPDFVLGGDVWYVAANLLEWVDTSSAHTTGALLRANAGAPQNSVFVDPSGDYVAATASATDSGSWSGYVLTSAGAVTTTVDESGDLQSEQPGLTARDLYHWSTESNVTTPGGPPVHWVRNATYAIGTQALAAFTVEDDSLEGTIIPGAGQTDRSIGELMTTAGPGPAFNGAQHERFTESDADWGQDGVLQHSSCYDRTLASVAGQLVQDDGGTCFSPPPPAL
jgi:hypothetical protein